MLAIVDVGLGNVAAVCNMLDRLGHPAERCRTPEHLSAGDRYLLPGVGAYDEGVRRLESSGWFDHLKMLPPQTHVLGICLGMQLLGTSSEEGAERGLGRMDVRFVRFKVEPLRVPHMGWNVVRPVGGDVLFDPGVPELRFYFTHSYYAVCGDSSLALCHTHYGIDFVSGVRSGNTRGVQFHPEKSHKFGMTLLDRWARLPC